MTTQIKSNITYAVMEILTTLICVAVMLAYAVPGFLLVKTKLVKADAIPAFARLLMYVCQPFLTLYAFSRVKFTTQSLIDISISFGLSVAINIAFLGLFFLIFRKRYEQMRNRIFTLACFFGNCLFMGLPLLEALLPDAPEAVIYANMFALTMNLIGWTAGSAIISGDKKYINAKQIFLNPAIISLAVALVFYFARVDFPQQIDDFITILGRMSTPMCMLIMGMRLATMPVKTIFGNWRTYPVVAVKQLLMPLTVFGLLYFIPLDAEMKNAFVIIASAPVASVVLNFAEMLGQGQNDAASLVLTGTVLSVATMPVISLLTLLL